MQLIDRSLLASVAEKAAQSPRRRMNHNFHSSMEDNPHRFLNVLLRGTYIRPHRHLDPPKPEAFLILEGEAGLLLFDDSGRVLESVRLGGGGAVGIDLEAGAWHTIVALSDRVVCYEVKPGPYVQTSDKDFAPWAPVEGEAAVGPYLESLAARFR